MLMNALQMMVEAERRLRSVGYPKINPQIRTTNAEVVAFYRAVGYSIDPVVSMGKRLTFDHPPIP